MRDHHERNAAEKLSEWETNHYFDPEKLSTSVFWLLVYPIGIGEINRLTALIKYQISETLFKQCIKEYKRWLSCTDQGNRGYNEWHDRGNKGP